MISSSQRTDSANTSTKRQNDSARIANAVTGEFAGSGGSPTFGGGHPKQLYPRDGDLQNVLKADGEMKPSRVVPGRTGLSLYFRIGLDMLDETLAEDRDARSPELRALPPARKHERRQHRAGNCSGARSSGGT